MLPSKPLRRSLLVSDGDATDFFTRPISGILLVVYVLVALLPPVRSAITRRRTAAAESRTKELV